MHNDICERVKQAGVVGAGGAGFPTYAKFSGGVDTVVVNGAECEPLLRVDQQLMEAAGLPEGKELGELKKKLFLHCVKHPKDNNLTRLIQLAKKR